MNEFISIVIDKVIKIVAPTSWKSYYRSNSQFSDRFV